MLQEEALDSKMESTIQVDPLLLDCMIDLKPQAWVLRQQINLLTIPQEALSM